jgi:hypothetical protein
MLIWFVGWENWKLRIQVSTVLNSSSMQHLQSCSRSASTCFPFRRQQLLILILILKALESSNVISPLKKYFFPSSLSVYLSVCLFVCLSICLYVYLTVCLSICLSVCLFVCLSIFVSLCLNVRMSVCSSICLHFCLSVSLL